MTLNRLLAPNVQTIENIKFPKEQKIDLKNGLPLYLLDGGTQDVLKIDILLPAGAAYAQKRLIAPLTGLMLNEGTEQKSAHKIAEIFDFYGAYFQPTVEKDHATLGLVTLNKHISNTLPTFYEAISQSNFPEKEFNNLIERRRQKFLVESEKTSFLAREAFFSQLFGESHRYGKQAKESDYLTTSRDEVFDFYKKQYHNTPFKIIVSGKINSTEINLIKDIFETINIGDHSDINIQKPNSNIINEPIIIEKPNAVQSSIRMGILTPNKNHTDYIGLKILTTILGGYFGSRLMKNIREEKGYTYGIHAMQVSLQNSGYMAIAADVMANKTKEAIIEIKKEINKLCTDLVSSNEINLVKNYMMGELLQMFDGPITSSEAFKAALEYNLGFEYYSNLKQQILEITPKEIQKLAIKYFDLNKFVTVIAGAYK